MLATVDSTITIVGTRPLVVHQVTPWLLGGRRSPVGYDLRNSGLRIMTYLVGGTVANLDTVRDARNLADIQLCPACGPGPRRAA